MQWTGFVLLLFAAILPAAPHLRCLHIWINMYPFPYICSLSGAAPRWTGLPFCCCHSPAQPVHRSAVALLCASLCRTFSVIVNVELASGLRGRIKKRETVAFKSVKWDATNQDMLMYWSAAEKLFLLLAIPVNPWPKSEKSVSLLHIAHYRVTVQYLLHITVYQQSR